MSVSGKLFMKIEMDRRTLKRVVDLVLCIVDEVRIEVNGDGVKMKYVDPAHVAMGVLTLKASSRGEEIEGTTGIDMNFLADVLRVMDDGDSVTLSPDDLTWTAEVDSGGLPLIMTLKTWDHDISKPSIIHLDSLECVFSVKIPHLIRAVRSAAEVSDHVIIEAGEGGVWLRAEGDVRRSEVLLARGTFPQARSAFPLDYFSSIVSSLESFDTVGARLGTDYLVSLGAEDEELKISFLLAPRIETD